MTEVQSNNVEASAKKTQSAGRLRAHLIKGATGSFALQLGFAGFSFLNAIILARVLGAKGYGAFANAMAWVSLLTIPATFGFGILLVRDVAIYRSQGKWGLLKGLLHFSNRFVLVTSVLLVIVAALIARFIFSSPEQTTIRRTLWVALPLVPVLALYNLRESAVRGLEYVIRARLPGMIIRPAFLLAGIGFIYFFQRQYLTPPLAMAINVGAGIAALSAGIYWIRQLLPREVWGAKAEFTTKPWLKAAFPMLVYGGAQIVLGQTDIVMLGALRGAEEVGLYAVANRLAFLLVYVVMAGETILAPVISRLYANNENDRLQKILTRVVRLSLLLVLPFGLLLIFEGAKILVIFGHDFTAAKIALIILVCGRILDVTLGSAALILSMVNHEHIVAVVFTTISVINIALNALLIPRYGLDGAALASVISLTLAKLLLSRYAAKKADIDTTVFGTLGRARTHFSGTA